MKTYQMTSLLLWINMLIDKGNKLEINKTINLIANKKVMEYLKDNYNEIDLSLYELTDLLNCNEIIYSEYDCYGGKGRIRKKLGIEKDGLTLIVALITSFIQNKFGDKILTE